LSLILILFERLLSVQEGSEGGSEKSFKNKGNFFYNKDIKATATHWPSFLVRTGISCGTGNSL
jgi:hypothetical protein